MARYQASVTAQSAQQAARARAALLQQMKLMREAQSDAARLNVADQARANGDVQTACRIYVRLSANRAANPATYAARERLGQLGVEAQQKLAELESRLGQWSNLSASDELDASDLEALAGCITNFRQLADQYGYVPQIGREIKHALTKRRNQPTAKAALFEPEARRLWDEGQALESAGEVCCAFLLYEEALRKLPAPSARAAEQRLAQLRSDPQHVAAAESCRNLQWCHQQYRLAERVARVQPERARELFTQIVERSPADTAIHADARDQLALLAR
jgi:hypothetical protein